MNQVLRIKQNLEQKPHGPGGGARNIHTSATPVDTEHLNLLIHQLEAILSWAQTEDLLPGAILDVEYRSVIPKSSRVQALLYGNGKKPNDTIVGARFSDGEPKHVITHYIPHLSTIEKTIEKLRASKAILDEVKKFGGRITHEQIRDLDDSIDYENYALSKSVFRDVIVDSYHVENFRIPQRSVDPRENSIVTIYDTGVDIYELMRKVGIEVQQGNLEYETTLLLSPTEIELLNKKAPFLIAMSTEELDYINPDDNTSSETQPDWVLRIDPPANEPVIGVIDKAFDKRVYFKDWVEYVDMLDENLPRSADDAIHGTAVTSIIVDGPSFNPELEDGCGRFKVKHFGVATGDYFSSFTIMKLIRQIVLENPDIKVWNLSLGSDKEIGKNSISPTAAMLDQLQSEHDVIFVVAGTNKSRQDMELEDRKSVV